MNTTEILTVTAAAEKAGAEKAANPRFVAARAERARCTHAGARTLIENGVFCALSRGEQVVTSVATYTPGEDGVARLTHVARWA